MLSNESLPVQFSIMFKLCTIAYQTLSSPIIHVSLAPKPRELYSSSFHLLSVPRFKIHAGTFVFSDVVPTICITLLILFLTNVLTCMNMSHQYAELPTTILRTSTV